MPEMRDVPGHPLRVSIDGRIVESMRSGVIKSQRLHKGYLTIQYNVHIRGRHKKTLKLYVHHLVLLAFIGPKPFPSAQCRHLDGNRENNHCENLKWGTALENCHDAIRHGTAYFLRWEGTSPARRVGKEDIEKMGHMRLSGESNRTIAAKFGVGADYVSDLLGGRTEANQHAICVPRPSPSDQDIEEMRRLRAQGRPLQEIADTFRVSVNYVRRRTLSPRRLTLDQVNSILQLHSQGRSQREIARRVGASKTGVLLTLRRGGAVAA
jgi:DNA-binding CsgD family transcriptional regulator